MKKISSTKNGENILEIEKICVARNFDPPKSSMGSYFQQKIPKIRSFLSLGMLWGYNEVPRPATPLKSVTIWGSCCLKTTIVVFVAKNC